MPRFPWSSKAEDGEKLQPDDDLLGFEFPDEEVSDWVDGADDEETAGFFVVFCQSCAASRGGVCPFHTEIPRLY